MIKDLDFNDKIDFGEYKGKTVKEIINEETSAKDIIFNLIKEEHIIFTDDVLKSVGIKRHVHSPTFKHIVIDRVIKETKALPKDRMKLDKILEELHTIDNDINKLNDNNDEFEETDE